MSNKIVQIRIYSAWTFSVRHDKKHVKICFENECDLRDIGSEFGIVSGHQVRFYNQSAKLILLQTSRKLLKAFFSGKTLPM